jgi:hypothetical protein
MRGKYIVGLLVSAVAMTAAMPGETQEAKVTLTSVKYQGLKHAVLQNRGKVVLVDFWGEF